jgi:ABC-2 type transport system permease protein
MTTSVGYEPETGEAEPRRTGGILPVRLIRAELIKIRTTNTWWIFAILLVATSALMLLFNLLMTNTDLRNVAEIRAKGLPDLSGMDAASQAFRRNQYLYDIDLHRVLANASANVFTSGQYFGLLFVSLVGCLIVTNEFFHQTATTTFLATPHRSQVILSKLVAGGLLAVGFWLLTTVIDVAVGSLYFSSNGYDILLVEWDVIRSMLLNLLAYVIWVVLGIGLGVLIRSQVGATVTAAAAYLLAYPAAFAFFGLIRNYVIQDDSVYQAMILVPGVDSQIMVSPERLPLTSTALAPPWWGGALILLAYAVLAGTIGTVLTRRRDIS